jgi:PHD/YefM family antitoxin component YafN of YafNO toxin-antitoxin module
VNSRVGSSAAWPKSKRGKTRHWNFIRISAIIDNIRKLSTTDMIRVSSTEFSKEVGRYQDAALSQPVVVTRNGRDRTVMISIEEYQRLKRRDRQVFAAGEAPEEIVEAVRNSEMDPRHRHLDDLVKDWAP